MRDDGNVAVLRRLAADVFAGRGKFFLTAVEGSHEPVEAARAEHRQVLIAAWHFAERHPLARHRLAARGRQVVQE